MSADSLLWRWYYYWWATETFDQSVPHWTQEHLSKDGIKRGVFPKVGWPQDASVGFSREMRIALDLTTVSPPHGIDLPQLEKLRSLLVPRWVRTAERACESRAYDGLEDFGISVSRGDPPRVYKFGQPLETSSDLLDALAGAVGFEPEQCAHAFVVMRDYRMCPIGLCLRCCTMRSTNEVTIHPKTCNGIFDQPPTRLEPAVEQSRRPSLSQPYAHSPADRDRFPLGHAPGDVAAFSAYLGGLRGRS